MEILLCINIFGRTVAMQPLVINSILSGESIIIVCVGMPIQASLSYLDNRSLHLVFRKQALNQAILEMNEYNSNEK